MPRSWEGIWKARGLPLPWNLTSSQMSESLGTRGGGLGRLRPAVAVDGWKAARPAGVAFLSWWGRMGDDILLCCGWCVSDRCLPGDWGECWVEDCCPPEAWEEC